MTDDLKPYPAYKDSRAPWLGDLPEHWEVRRIRNAVDFRVSNVDKHTKDGEQPIRLCNYVDVYKNDRITEYISFMPATATGEEIKHFRLELDDVLITKDSEAWDDIGVPALVEYTAEDLVCGYHLALLRPRRAILSGAYLLRAMQSSVVAYQFHIAANGVTRYGLSHEAIKSVQLPVPSISGQDAIVRYLDNVDRKISRYIRAKKKLIGLLNEQKQAIIHQAVTRGLDPNVKLKPSGVEWLGNLPAHWDVMAIARFARVGNGSTPSRGNAAYWDGGMYPWLNSSSVNRGVIEYAEQFVTDIALRECHLPRVSTESVLVAITGQGKTRGTAALLKLEATINQHIAYITPKSGIVTSEFLRMALIAGYHELRRLSDDAGGTKGALTCEDLKQFKIPIPPIAEQRVLTSNAIKQCRAADIVIERTNREIDLLSAYRMRLIADVVTGKFDVRDAAAKLPDMKVEAEPCLDEVEDLLHDDSAVMDELDEAAEAA